MNRSYRGFTLIELLVVITIIGVLIAIIIPAVNAIREYGRQTACLNNQLQIGKAIISYDTSKNRLPGLLNTTAGGAVKYNWIEAILPNLERADLWELVESSKLGTSTPRLDVVICPDDPWLVNATSANAQAPLSYGVNSGYFLDYTQTTPSRTPAILSRLMNAAGGNVSPSATVMVGEQTGDTSGNAHAVGRWTSQVANQISFPDPGAGTGGLSSNHPGIIVVVYFDGSGAKVAQ